MASRFLINSFLKRVEIEELCKVLVKSKVFFIAKIRNTIGRNPIPSLLCDIKCAFGNSNSVRQL